VGLSSKTAVAYFDSHAEYYEQNQYRTARRTFVNARHERIVDMLGTVGLNERATVLDAGCGPGNLVGAFARRCGRLYAMDASPRMLQIARTNGREFPNVEYQVGSIDALPFADGSFDVVCSAGVIEYLKDCEGAIREMQRVLRPGGVLILPTTNAVAPAHWLRRVLAPIARIPLVARTFGLQPGNYPLYYQFIPEFKRRVHRAGLTIERERYFYLTLPRPMDRMFPRVARRTEQVFDRFMRTAFRHLAEGYIAVARKPAAGATAPAVLKKVKTDTPVVVAFGQLGGLAIMRSLGALGVRLYGVDANPSAPALLSRYCRERVLLPFSERDTAAYIDGLLGLGKRIGRRSILIPTSDETTLAVADHRALLREHFLFQDNSPELLRALASKREMFGLATMHGVPTPHTVFPTSVKDVEEYAETGRFPVMLKGIYGNRLQLRTRKKMSLVHSAKELMAEYREMEDPDDPNLMLQEYIPGGDDQVYIFNGYFDRNSDCLAGFTGHKIRQFPVHVGCASLGVCRWNETVARITTDFMKRVGYQGILDIGYRLDPRDGQYKVLDINPRVGQAFRLFVAENNHDVIRALYLDYTGQPQPAVVPREGRRWMIEDYDLISSLHYYQEGTLRPAEWLRSFAGVQEGAWFSWRDPRPFLAMSGRLTGRAFSWARRQLQ
jgi:predicted ATP-grasp superfamily ATP-dependent carboligase/ubiquinone/menaquinone biosynthesis C-methylase UbiE